MYLALQGAPESDGGVGGHHQCSQAPCRWHSGLSLILGNGCPGRRQGLDDVAGDNIRRVTPGDLDRRPQPREPSQMFGPDAGKQPPSGFLVIDRNRMPVDTHPRADLDDQSG